MDPFANKSTPDEIRTRFDNDVERFSSLETGQQAAKDSLLMLELVAQTCATHLKPGDQVLDLGCGAGNFTLRVLQEVQPLDCHLVDLSQPMLTRAKERVAAAGMSAATYQSDLRDLEFAPAFFDAILAGAVLHHLRDDTDWLRVFTKLHAWLRPGGRLYVADLTCFDSPEVQALMWDRYGRYLESLGGAEYRDKVFAYVEKEDSPRSLTYQLDLARRVGFSSRDVLHRNGVFACYFAIK